MKNLFTDIQLSGIMVFTDKSNWKETLIFLKNTLGKNQFFFFFDSERGYHLKICCTHFAQNHLEEISQFLLTLPHSGAPTTEDPLFKNVPPNTLLPLQNIAQISNIQYPDALPNKVYDVFLRQLSSIVIDALRYNDFFIEEKNRINFAIQLIFMALVKANKAKIKTELDNILEEQSNSIDEDSPLVNFYKDVQKIESEERTEIWVIDWLAVSADFLSGAPFETLVESICILLEIRSFAPQLLMMMQAVLAH